MILHCISIVRGPNDRPFIGPPLMVAGVARMDCITENSFAFQSNRSSTRPQRFGLHSFFGFTSAPQPS